MNNLVKLGGYVAGLAVVFGATWGAGKAIGPVGTAAAPSHSAHQGAAADGATGSPSVELPGGLQIFQSGYTLDVARQLPAGTSTQVSFRILGPNGRPVTAYDTVHDQRLHLIAVRRDLTGFQHVHPQLAADGTWSIPLHLTAGDWRLFADVSPTGANQKLVLGADVAVAGEYLPQALPEPERTAVVDGYTVTLAGDLLAGQGSELTLSVSRGGKPVTDLQPYLAAYGHLVALRAGDLAYLHVHPGGAPGDGVTAAGPQIAFGATAPSVGRYRLFLDFKHGDVVRTAAFTVDATAVAPTRPTGDDAHPAGPQDAGHVHG